MIKYPEKIKKGDIIGVVATSMGIIVDVYNNRLDKAYENAKNMGYHIIETESVRKNEKFVSADGKTRASEFMKLWENNNIRLIAQVYGGEFLMEMLPYINSEVILNNSAKWVTGYSDSSLLNFYLTTNFNIATATTANIIDFGIGKIDNSLLKQFEILEDGKKSVQYNFKLYEKEKYSNEDKNRFGYNLTEQVKYNNLYGKEKEKFSGRLIGGCIDTISQLLGTPYDKTVEFCNSFKEGMLWYLEDCELNILELYRTLWRMKISGYFKNINGIIFGRTSVNTQIEDFSYLDVLHKIFDDMNIPVIYDVDFGHVAPQWTMINGSYATFEYDNKKGSIVQEMI